VAAAGNGVVWISVGGSRLFRSRDRGETWEERVLPPRVFNSNIAFVDDRNGWLLTAGSPATGCMAQYFEIWRTTDGALTWQKVVEDSFSASSGCKITARVRRCSTRLHLGLAARRTSRGSAHE